MPSTGRPSDDKFGPGPTNRATAHTGIASFGGRRLALESRHDVHVRRSVFDDRRYVEVLLGGLVEQVVCRRGVHLVWRREDEVISFLVLECVRQNDAAWIFVVNLGDHRLVIEAADAEELERLTDYPGFDDQAALSPDSSMLTLSLRGRAVLRTYGCSL